MSQTEEYTEIKLVVPWGYIAAKTYGPSTGKCVLMVHGRQDNAGTFTRLMKYLPTNFYYVCIDLPGHGFSSHFPPGLPIDIMHLVCAIHFVLEALQWERCIYIGHSMGGQIGVLFSAFQPHRIKKMISIDALPLMSITNDNIIKTLEGALKHVITANSNTKPPSYTKEEALYAFKNMRISALNSDAANALFERGVTDINGKYTYNRDIRLKYYGLVELNVEQNIELVRKISVPTYILITSHGLSKINARALPITMTIVNTNTLLQVIHVDGNHDVHNNQPENVGPIISKLLKNNDYSSKL